MGVTMMFEHSLIRSITKDYAGQFYARIISAVPPVADWPNDVVVPFAQHSDIVQSMNIELRTIMGLAALERSGSHCTSALIEEVRNGKSTVIQTGTGEVERVVSLATLRIERFDGCSFVSLGKWT